MCKFTFYLGDVVELGQLGVQGLLQHLPTAAFLGL